MASLTRRIQRASTREKFKNHNNLGTRLGITNDQAKDRVARLARENRVRCQPIVTKDPLTVDTHSPQKFLLEKN